MKFFFKNLGTKILALIASILFWFFLLGVQNSFYEITDKIEVINFNLAEEYVLAGENPLVKIKVNADPAQFPKLSAQDFEAFINLDGLTVGVHKVPVLVSSKLSDVSVLRVEPSEVNIQIEESQEKQVPLIISINGKAADGFEVVKASAKIENVKIKGGKNLKDAQNANVVIDLEGNERKTFNKDFKAVVVDSLGEQLSGITIDPEQINITIEISKAKATKTVAVIVNLHSELKEQYDGKVQIVPNQIVVQGDEELLAEILEVSTELVIPQDLAAGKTITKEFVLPEGLELKENETASATLNFQ